MLLTDSFKTIDELKYISTDSDIELVENNVSVLTIDDDDTIKDEKTLIAPDTSPDTKEFVNQKSVENEAVNGCSISEKDTIRSEESRGSSIYETISETYCSDASELSNVSSVSDISLDSSDDSVKLLKLTEDNETNCNQVGHKRNRCSLVIRLFSTTIFVTT